MRKTKNRKSVIALKQALLSLMRKKPFPRISVKELCEEAGLNRSTFYANYTDIHALLLDIHTDIFQELTPDSAERMIALSTGTMENRIASVTEIISYLQDHLDIFGPLFMNNEGNLFEQHLGEYYLKKYGVAQVDTGMWYIFLYHLMGSFSMVHQWISDQCPCTPKELAKLICMQSENIARFIQPYDALPQGESRKC